MRVGHSNAIASAISRSEVHRILRSGVCGGGGFVDSTDRWPQLLIDKQTNKRGPFGFRREEEEAISNIKPRVILASSFQLQITSRVFASTCLNLVIKGNNCKAH